MGDFMQWLAWLLLELQVPAVPDWLLRDPHFQHGLKQTLILYEVERSDSIRYHWWVLGWEDSLKSYEAGKDLPSLSVLYQFGLSSSEATGQLWQRIEWARNARQHLQDRVNLLPRPLRPDYQPLLDEFDYRIWVWMELNEAATTCHSYANPLGARHKLKALMLDVGDAVRDGNLGPIIPDGYWRVLR